MINVNERGQCFKLCLSSTHSHTNSFGDCGGAGMAVGSGLGFTWSEGAENPTTNSAINRPTLSLEPQPPHLISLSQSTTHHLFIMASLQKTILS